MRGRNKIELRKTLVRRIQNELWLLRRARANPGQVPLEKPIRNGWFKHLTLRDDISRREDAKVFQEILDVSGINRLQSGRPKSSWFW